jgi:hypothetical protein
MVTCTRKADGADCDRNYRNRTIVETCPENRTDIGSNKAVYNSKDSARCCLFALGE